MPMHHRVRGLRRSQVIRGGSDDASIAPCMTRTDDQPARCIRASASLGERLHQKGDDRPADQALARPGDRRPDDVALQGVAMV